MKRLPHCRPSTRLPRFIQIEPLESRIAPAALASYNLADLDGTNGFKLSGEAAYDRSGHSVSAAGDVNGDGFDDFIIGAFGADPNGSYFGASYVVFGKASGFSATMNLSTLNGSNGFKFQGEVMSDQSGRSVSAAGDATVKGGGASGEWSGSAFKSVAVTVGALAADITIMGAIAKITVKGGGLSGDLEAASFGEVTVTGGDLSGTLTSLTSAATLAKILALKSLTVTDGDLTGDIRLLGNSGAIHVKGKTIGGNITGASIVAGKIAAITVAHNVASSIILAGAELGSDHTLGGSNDIFGVGSIGAVKIVGSVSGSSVIGSGFSSADAVFKNGDDMILGGVTSSIKSLSIGGAAASGSYFVAGIFNAVPKIGGGIVATTDPRFKVA